VGTNLGANRTWLAPVAALKAAVCLRESIARPLSLARQSLDLWIKISGTEVIVMIPLIRTKRQFVKPTIETTLECVSLIILLIPEVNRHRPRPVHVVVLAKQKVNLFASQEVR
jgi:hypothetical protein